MYEHLYQRAVLVGYGTGALWDLCDRSKRKSHIFMTNQLQNVSGTLLYHRYWIGIFLYKYQSTWYNFQYNTIDYELISYWWLNGSWNNRAFIKLISIKMNGAQIITQTWFHNHSKPQLTSFITNLWNQTTCLDILIQINYHTANSVQGFTHSHS